jgi:hypothetical protein
MSLFLTLIVVCWKSNYFRYGLSDLALPDRYWMVFVSCQDEVCPRNVLENGDPYYPLPSDIDRVVQFIFPRIMVLVLMPMLADYVGVHVVLALRQKLKL